MVGCVGVVCLGYVDWLGFVNSVVVFLFFLFVFVGSWCGLVCFLLVCLLSFLLLCFCVCYCGCDLCGLLYGGWIGLLGLSPLGCLVLGLLVCGLVFVWVWFGGVVWVFGGLVLLFGLVFCVIVCCGLLVWMVGCFALWCVWWFVVSGFR